MSQLETRAQRDLTAMIRGQQVYLSADRQAAVAAWACKIAMMLEYAGDGNRERYFAQEERNYLRENAQPPPGVVVCLGYYFGAQHIWVHGFDGTNTSQDGEVADACAAGMSFGKLFIYAISKRTRETRYPFRRAVADAILVQVWPVVGDVAEWPPPEGITTPQRDELTEADQEEQLHPRSLNRPAKYLPSRITAR